jgi:putative redox protein
MITGIRKDGLVAEITARGHTITSGLPEKLGGRDEGPDPHELLEAALAGCTILTAQLYANRKGMKLESTDVKVKIVSEGKDSVINREVSFRGDLTPEEKARLLEIVNKCPIHNLLESNIKIETTAT